MPGGRVNTISTRMTLEEKNRLLARVTESGLTESAFVRQKLLGEDAGIDGLRLLAAEVRAMRSMLFQLVTAALTKQVLTEDKIRQIVEHSDATKYERGSEAILEFRQAQERGAA